MNNTISRKFLRKTENRDKAMLVRDRRYRVYKIHLIDDDSGVDVGDLEASGIRNTSASFRHLAKPRPPRPGHPRPPDTRSQNIFWSQRALVPVMVFNIPDSVGGVASNSVVTLAVFSICHSNLTTLVADRHPVRLAGSRSNIPNTGSSLDPESSTSFTVKNFSGKILELF